MSQNPTTSDFKTSNGTLSQAGSFTCNLSNLTPGKTYYVRAYLTYKNGTIFGTELSFNTSETDKPVVTTKHVTEVGLYTATAGGEVTEDGGLIVTQRGVVWSTDSNPTVESNDGITSDESGTGSFTSDLTELAEGTNYYVRAYATNEAGTSYGLNVDFTTIGLVPPTVTTSDPTDVTTNTAKCGGNVTDDGNGTITIKGVVWSTNQNPTLENNTGFTNDGSDIGSFTSDLTNLQDGTTYYVKAHASNEKGTSYGEQKDFTALGLSLPTVSTTEPSDVTINSAKSGGNVSSDGGSSVTSRGVVWSTNQNPTITNNLGKTTNGSGTGSFTSSITGLSLYTTYYVRAYATNGVGTNYGSQKEFVSSSQENIITLEDDNSYDFSSGTIGAYSGGDFYFSLQSELKFWANNVGQRGLQDLGDIGQVSLDQVDPPSSGYSRHGVEAYTDHTYVSLAQEGEEGHYIIFRILNLTNNSVTIQYLYIGITIPTVSTTTPSNISTNSAISGGNVSSDGGSTVTARGVVWNTSQNPTVSSYLGKTTDGSGTGSFTSNITGLTANTTYFVRTYATNSEGTGYGSEVSFTTLQISGATVTDIEGNVYNTLAIGTQEWMAENLKTTKFNDNTSIPLVTNNTAWSNLITPGYCWYNNNAGNYKATYGGLYNWYTVNTGKICPTGWHVPEDTEWTTLITYLGDESVAGGKLKETGTSHWVSPNTGATNETGFTALPGGFRGFNSTFIGIGSYGLWWSSTEYFNYNAWSPLMYSFNSSVAMNYGDKWVGSSVRCVKD